MFPEIPEDRTGLNAASLRGLVRELNAYAKAKRAKGERDADFARAIELATAIMAEANDRQEAEDAAAAQDADLDATDLPDEAVQASDTGDNGGDDDDDPPVQVDGGDPPDDGGAAATPGTGLATVPSGLSTGAVTVREPALRPDVIVARDGVPGYESGHAFANWAEVGDALIQRWGTINPNSESKFTVAQINADYPAERRLSETDVLHNMRVLGNLAFNTWGGGAADELTAAICAPLTPYYGMACENTLRRPVAASLPGFQAPRGGVSIMPSPTLADVDQAGIWTHEDDDADLDQVENRKPCDTIVCGTPEDFIMYAVYWCLTVKNWHLLTYPELVEAFLNRGLALRARVAERQLLEGLAAGVPSINVPATGYSSSVQVLTQILTYIDLYREEQRWDSIPLKGWAHRWLLSALRLDQARRRRTDGRIVIPSEGEINAQFASVGVDMTWSLDTASWMTPPPILASAGNMSTGLLGTLGQFGGDAEILVAPVGKFAMIDRAQIGIGVTGNNYYRGTPEIERNEVRYFVENYEGVVDTTSCPAHRLDFTGLCHTGVQIDDVAIDCEDLTAAA